MIVYVLVFAVGVSAGAGALIAYQKYFGQAKSAALGLEASAKAAFQSKLAAIEKAIAEMKAAI